MKLKEPYILTELGDDIIAMPKNRKSEASDRIIRLNETAADIWRGIEREKTAEEIAADLVEKYDGIDLAEALKHVKNTVEKLRSSGVVEE